VACALPSRASGRMSEDFEKGNKVGAGVGMGGALVCAVIGAAPSIALLVVYNNHGTEWCDTAIGEWMFYTAIIGFALAGVSFLQACASACCVAGNKQGGKGASELIGMLCGCCIVFPLSIFAFVVYIFGNINVWSTQPFDKDALEYLENKNPLVDKIKPNLFDHQGNFDGKGATGCNEDLFTAGRGYLIFTYCLAPSIFLLACCCICCGVAVASGSGERKAAKFTAGSAADLMKGVVMTKPAAAPDAAEKV